LKSGVFGLVVKSFLAKFDEFDFRIRFDRQTDRQSVYTDRYGSVHPRYIQNLKFNCKSLR
jgi:hypothetical protein